MEDTTSKEGQKLKYLYTLVKSRLFGIKKRKNYITVADLSAFLNSIKENVLDLKTIENRDHIEKYRNEFVNKLKNKIAAADDMIQKNVLPFIDGKIKETKDGVTALTKELEGQRKIANKALENAKKNEETLKQKALANGILGVLDLAATGLSFLGPQCAIIGAGLKVATSVAGAIVDKTLTTVEVKMPSKINEDRVMKVANVAKKQIGNIEIQCSKLREIQNILAKSDPSSENNTQLDKIQKSIEKIKKNGEINPKTNLPNNDNTEILKKLFKDLSDIFKDLKGNDKIKENPNAKKSMEELENLMTFGSELAGCAEEIAGSLAKIGEAETVTKQVNRQIELIKLQELNILHVMTPQLTMMVESIQSTAKAKGQDHVQLIVARWSMQNTLSDVKDSFDDISKGFDVNEDLKSCIKKITEAIITVMEVHNQVDSYRDTEQLANLIADISNTPNEIHNEEPKWFDDMKVQIKKNLVIEQYEMAMSAVKHHMFPFVEEYLLESDKIYKNVTDEKDLIAKVAFKIDQMLDQINEDKALVTRDKNHIAGPYNFERDEAFYRWDQKGFKSEMQNLFNGSKVTLYADINRGLALSGIKFNKIWIRFVLSDSNKEREFNEKLERLKVRFELEMQGNTFYRCDNRIYYMPLDEPIQFFLTLNNTNPREIRDPGGAYETLQQNAFFLSPYTTWQISLEAKKLEGLNQFSDYVSEILLEGTGKHLERKDKSFIQEICSESLDEYYSLDTINAI